MLKKISLFALAGIFLIGGCASRESREEASASNQKILRENETRLHELENSVTALNSQVAQLNSRVYEVRTRTGQKTSMKVVPVQNSPAASGSAPEAIVVPPPPAPLLPLSNEAPGNAQAAVQPAQKAATTAKTTPKGRIIDPKTKPTPLPAASPAPAAPVPAAKKPAPAPATAGAAGRIGQPEATAGPRGSIAPAANDDLALPPADLPPRSPEDEGVSVMAPASNAVSVPPANTQTDVAVPTGNAQTPVPVPLMPEADLSLPPEHATAAPPPAQATPTPAAPKPAPQAARAPAKGEEAAYRAALNAARSGRTAEGIRLFRDFLRQYPNGRYAANADYWIGECLYSEGKYRDALSQFQNVNSSYPSHHKNADALLKAAITMNRLGDKAGAQEKFRTLLSTFPNSDAARRARAMGAGR